MDYLDKGSWEGYAVAAMGMGSVLNFIATQPAMTLWGAGVVVLLVSLVNLWIVGRMKRRLAKVLTISPGNDLDRILLEMQHRLQEMADAESEVRRRVSEVVAAQDLAFHRVGIVRFNAFDDTGSDLSFSIALLNSHGDGIVLSSIYGRNESRVYAKPIQAFRSVYALTQEEKQAIEQTNQESARANVAATAEAKYTRR